MEQTLSALKIVQDARAQLMNEHWTTSAHREAYRVLCAVCGYLCGVGRSSSVNWLEATMSSKKDT